MARRGPKSSGLDGLLLVDKDRGGTSHDVVGRARRALGQRKIGHCGTLDPEATGLLLLTLGRATRLTRFLIRAPKVYEGTIVLGTTTDTYDAVGHVTQSEPVPADASAHLDDVMSSFEGDYLQTPPPYSAKKVGGRKSYELARQGEAVELPASAVEIFEFRATSPLEDDRFEFRLSCSSGTYARSLAHEVGQKLGCGAHLCALRRTHIGPFEVTSALPERTLSDSPEEALDRVVPFNQIPLPFDELRMDPTQERRIQHGQTIVVSQLDAAEGDWLKLVNSRTEFVAVASVVERVGAKGVGVVQPRIVFKG